MASQQKILKRPMNVRGTHARADWVDGSAARAADGGERCLRPGAIDDGKHSGRVRDETATHPEIGSRYNCP
jgi:hypothetical protein